MVLVISNGEKIYVAHIDEYADLSGLEKQISSFFLEDKNLKVQIVYGDQIGPLKKSIKKLEKAYEELEESDLRKQLGQIIKDYQYKLKTVRPLTQRVQKNNIARIEQALSNYQITRFEAESTGSINFFISTKQGKNFGKVFHEDKKSSIIIPSQFHKNYDQISPISILTLLDVSSDKTRPNANQKLHLVWSNDQSEKKSSYTAIWNTLSTEFKRHFRNAANLSKTGLRKVAVKWFEQHFFSNSYLSESYVNAIYDGDVTKEKLFQHFIAELQKYANEKVFENNSLCFLSDMDKIFQTESKCYA